MNYLPLFLCLTLVIVLLLVRVPIAFAFASGALILCSIYNVNVTGAITSGFSLITKFALLPLSLFCLLGTILNQGALAERLVDFVYSLVGRMKSGLGIALVLTNTVFGTISGSASAALATLIPIFVPQMEKKGYPKGHSIAFAISSAVLSLLIPPSGNSIFFAVIAQISVIKLFAATLLPGIILTVFLCTVQVVLARKLTTIEPFDNISKKEQAKRVLQGGKKSFWLLLLPLIIMGGIYGGVFSPTEAAAVSVVYAIFISVVIYRVLNLRGLWDSTLEAGRIIGTMIIVFFFVFMIVRVLIILEVPNYILHILTDFTDDKYLILMMLNVILFITGMFVDDTAGLMLAAFIYMPVAKAAGIDPIHFGVVVQVNLGMGLITPPVAPLLYLGGVLGKAPLREYIKPTTWCLLFAYLPTIIIVTYVPWVSTFLPDWLVSLRGG